MATIKRGIYLIANDMVIEQTTALLNSIRCYDHETPICIIPYDSENKKIKVLCDQLSNVSLWDDVPLLEKLDKQIIKIFGKQFFDKPNKLRKLSCWLGPFDEFLYIDTDIVVFEKSADNLKTLKSHDFICCDYQYKNGLKDVFIKDIIDQNILDERRMRHIFNSGFWMSKKSLFSKINLYSALEDCARHIQYFDFSSKVTDQPVLNYLILKYAQNPANLVKDFSDKESGNWAGCNHFISRDNKLYDPNVEKPLKFLHWAGIEIKPGCPYWSIWQYYRKINKPQYCFCTLALGKKYQKLAQRLAEDILRYSPGIFFIIGTDRPNYFKKNKNVIAFKLKQSGVMFPYHDRRFLLQKALKLFRTAIHIDADCRMIKSVNLNNKWEPGIYSGHIEPLEEHIKKYRPKDYPLILKASEKIGVNIKKAFFIGESIMAVSIGDKKENEFFKTWERIAPYLEIHKMVTGQGNGMGLSALKAGWIPQTMYIDKIAKSFKHLDASQWHRNFIERQKFRFLYHYRLNKAKLLALKDFKFYYK